jgi:hypothetical protein
MEYRGEAKHTAACLHFTQLVQLRHLVCGADQKQTHHANTATATTKKPIVGDIGNVKSRMCAPVWEFVSIGGQSREHEIDYWLTGKTKSRKRDATLPRQLLQLKEPSRIASAGPRCHPLPLLHHNRLPSYCGNHHTGGSIREPAPYPTCTRASAISMLP